MTLGLAAFAATLTLQGADFGVNLDDALVDGETTYIFLAPILVADGEYLDAQWSDDGRYLLMLTERQLLRPFEFERDIAKQSAPQVTYEATLSVANLRTGASKELWAAKLPNGSRAGISYFRNSDVAVVTVSAVDGTTTVLRITAGTSSVEVVETLRNAGEVGTSIGKDYAAVSAENPPSVRFIGRDGPVLRRQPLSLPSTVSFTTAGVAVVNAAKAPHRHLTIVPGGEEQWVEGLPKFNAFDEEFGKQRIEIENPSVALAGTTTRIPMVVAHISGRNERITLATNALASFYRRDIEQGVLITMGEFHFVRPVVKVPSSIYLEIASRQERARLTDNLTKIGKALSTYLRDKKRYPTQEEFHRAMERYLADAEIANGFTYAGLTEAGASPSTTAAGFAKCRGGRMVLYQDGHVAFVAND